MGKLESSSVVPTAISQRRILLLDDELTVRQALGRLINALGHQCTAVSTGEELLAVVESTSQSFDLAILDIKIPGGMGGIETMQNLLKMGSSIPVVSMSGYAPEDVFSNQEDRDGFSSHLQKPFSKAELVCEIERLCPVVSGDVS